MEMKGLFDMTRRERRATIVLLALIALMLAFTAVSRHHHEAVEGSVNAVEIIDFDAQTDSMQTEVATPTRQPREHGTSQKHQLRGRAKPKPKPAREPRPVDPVPKF